MKIKFLTVLSLIVLFICSCNQSENIVYTYKEIEKKIDACREDDAVYLKLKYPVIKNNEILNKEIENFVICDYTDVTDNIQGIIDNFTNDYSSFKEKFPDENFGCWFLELNIEVTNDTLNIISFEQSHDEYRGGAHPSNTKYYLNFDYEENKLIHINNISKDFNKLRDVARDIFFETYEIRSDRDLEQKFMFRDNQFYLPDNFYFTENSIVFAYTTYEIAPYSKGEVKLEIPYSKLGDNLNYRY